MSPKTKAAAHAPAKKDSHKADKAESHGKSAKADKAEKAEKKSAKGAKAAGADEAPEGGEAPQVDPDELEEAEETAAAASSGGNSSAAAAQAAASTEMSASFKNFRHHPDMENFYRFIYENDLRHEALAIIDDIIVEKAQRKQQAKGGKSAH